jgi:hypothetical protein
MTSILANDSNAPDGLTAPAGVHVFQPAEERFRLPAFEPIGNCREGFALRKGHQADRVGTREPTRFEGASPSAALTNAGSQKIPQPK